MENTFTFSPAMRQAHQRYMFAMRRLNGLPEDIDTDEENLLSDAYNAAREALIDTAAQTIDDLRVKFDVMCLDPASSPSRECIQSVFRDLQRLSSEKPSPVFLADSWLAWFERRGGGWVERDGEILLLAPQCGKADYCFDELRAAGACEVVKETLRQRVFEREVV